MILVTVGTMLPFDRLVRAMDGWAAQHPTEDVFAQIGRGRYEPHWMHWTRLITPDEFTRLVGQSSAIIAHAGIGSFLEAAEMRKPIVMLSRLASNREHTTDHQVHTARWLQHKPGVYIATTERELPSAIEKALRLGYTGISELMCCAPEPFLRRIREFLIA